MANRSATYVRTVHGRDPQKLIDTIVRQRIYDSMYWKEHCFGLSAESLLDRAVELDHIGGMYGGNPVPTPFICLLLKMLQIQPENDIVEYLLTQSDFKYVRALAAVYVRMTYDGVEVYKRLRPLYADYRKLRMKSDTKDGFELTHVDEHIDALLRDRQYMNLTLPPLIKWWKLEESNVLEAYRSPLQDELDAMDDEDLADLEKEIEEEELAQAALAAQEKLNEKLEHEKEVEDQVRSNSPTQMERPRERREEGSSKRRERETERRGSGHERHDDRRGDRYGRDRSSRRRSRSRSPGRSRRRRSRSRSRERHRDSRDRRDRHRERSRSPKRSRTESGRKSKGGNDESLSVEETNKLRAELGLPPLKM